MPLPAPLDLTALAGPRPPAVAGTIEFAGGESTAPSAVPELRMRLRWQPGCNGGRGAFLADFYSPAGEATLLGRRVVLCADLFDGHHVPVAELPADRALRVWRPESERELVIDGRRVIVDLRGLDPGLYDLGSGGVVIEVAARSPGG